MEVLFEVLFQFFGEFLLQLIAELMAELGVHAKDRRKRRPIRPALAIFGLIVCGAAAGVLSLLIFPQSPIADPVLRLANLFITPFLLGFAMMLVGTLREKKGQDLVRLDRFSYAFVFAFSMALVRFIWAA